MTRIQLPGAAGWIIRFSLIKPGHTVRTFIYCKDHSNILKDIKEGSARAACHDSLLQAPLAKFPSFHLPTGFLNPALLCPSSSSVTGQAAILSSTLLHQILFWVQLRIRWWILTHLCHKHFQCSSSCINKGQTLWHFSPNSSRCPGSGGQSQVKI